MLLSILAHAKDDVLRYRGDYTFGHEVNSFCPEINSQCYWVGAGTPGKVRAELQRLVSERTTEPYESICVVVEGAIDRDTTRRGFAADFDGLMTLMQVYGACDETMIVTQGDLQHHRWLLENVNNNVLVPEDYDYLVPELDFGERMHVAGNTGCNRFTGTGVLREDTFTIETVASTRRLCASNQNELERAIIAVLTGQSQISIGKDKSLVLKSSTTVLRFYLSDWVK